MSLQKKLNNAAITAATEAVQTERGRCLWLLDCMVKAADETVKAEKVSEHHKLIMETKMELALAIVGQLRRGIISGLRPPTPFSTLRQPINDVGELQTRISKLIDLLNHLGYGENTTIEDVEKQIVKWEAQEDVIDELEYNNQELKERLTQLREEADHR